MPPRRSASGYRGVRARPSSRFDAEIRSGVERIRLGTFDTAQEAARAYDAVAWRLGRSRRTMNFHDVWTREQAEELAPPLPAVTERDERLRLEWARKFPDDVTAMEAFYAQKEEQKAAAWKAEKAARRAEEKKNGARPSMIVLSSSSSSEWTSTPVSDTTPASDNTHSSDFDWDSE
nr:ethylene-responsive transcription factor RAP2-13-like [Lolium perenne]